MDRSLSELYVLMALNPEKGRIGLNDIHFRYSLTGALFMEYHQKGEFILENKRVVPSFRNNGEIIQTIRDIQAAIVASVIAASAAAHSSH